MNSSPNLNQKAFHNKVIQYKILLKIFIPILLEVNFFLI